MTSEGIGRAINLSRDMTFVDLMEYILYDPSSRVEEDARVRPWGESSALDIWVIGLNVVAENTSHFLPKFQFEATKKKFRASS